MGRFSVPVKGLFGLSVSRKAKSNKVAGQDRGKSFFGALRSVMNVTGKPVKGSSGRWIKQISDEIKSGGNEDGSGNQEVTINVRHERESFKAARRPVTHRNVHPKSDSITSGVQANAQLISAINNNAKVVGKYSS